MTPKRLTWSALLFAIGVPALLGLSYLFLETRAGSAARHTAVAESILTIETLDSRIQREVMACRVQDTPDYAPLTALQREQRAVMIQLQERLPEEAARASLAALSAQLAHTDDSLQTFMESNSRLRGVLRGLPGESERLQVAAVPHPDAFLREVDELVEALLLLESRSNASRAIWVAAEAAAALQSHREHLSPAVAGALTVWLSRVATLTAEHQILEKEIAALSSPRVSDALVEVDRAHRGILARQEQRAELYTAALYCSALVLFLALAVVARRLASMQSRLEVLVEQRTAELRSARDAAEASARAKSAFLATMSHELRTPMNGVLGMAQLLHTTPLSPSQQQFLGTLEGSGQSLLVLIDEILDYSHMETGRAVLDSAPLSLSALLRTCQRIIAPQAADKSLRLTVSMDAGVSDERVGDPDRLKQVLLSLLSNAIKFTAEGAVEVSVEESDGRVCFLVTDTGIGICSQQLGGLFQTFSQVDSSNTRAYGGTGLGLALSRRIVEQMGGEIGVRSQPGEGSTFWFAVPLAHRARRASA